MKQMKYTISDFRADFPDEEACLVWLKEYLYPDGIYCKIDKKITPHHRMKTRKSWSCEMCGHHVHPTAGTIFHKSTTPLTSWFYAVYLMASTRAGISAKQLERELGVTYKTAWRMFHQIRKMMADDDDTNLTGDVEIDEAYIGPNPKWRRASSKVPNWKHQGEAIIGVVQRDGKAKVKHIGKSTNRAMLPFIEASVSMKDATVYTDQYSVYKNLYWQGYTHKTINHSQGDYVRGTTHTQNVENLWSNMKRGIKGVYRHVDPKYLQAYADEYAFRYSHRNDFQPMFWSILGNVAKP